MVGILLFLLLFASVFYAALGGETQTIVLLSLPSDSVVVQAVQSVYCVAIFFTYPLMFYPVTGILESWLIPRSGAYDRRAKYQKNGLRTLLVAFCSVAALMCDS